MNAKDIAYGYAIGYNDGIGSGGGDEKDSDYAKWENLIEPAENQAVFLVRVPNTAAKPITMTIGYAIDMYYEDTWTVDWGDGTSSTGYSRQGTVSHDYSAIGEYTVIFTSHMVSCNNSAAVTSALLIMAKYGSLIHAESNLNSMPFNSQTYLRYVRLIDDTVFVERYFTGCSALRNIFFNGSIEAIYDYMFTNCNTLDFSNLKFSVLSIGQYAFNSCYNLKKIEMPECNTVGANAFGYCYSLKKAMLPECNTVGAYAFGYCYSLKKAMLPKCYSVGAIAFGACYALNQAVFADNCTFGANVFSNCYSLYPRPDGSTD